MYLLALSAAALSADGCSSREDADERLVVMVDRAIAFYAGGDLPAFDAAAREAQALLPCVQEPVDRATAARFHVVQGLLRMGKRDGEALPFLAAARRSEAAVEGLPAGIRDEIGGPGSVGAAAAVPKKDEKLPPPLTGRLVLDGRQSRARPEGEPVVIQQVSREDRVLSTAYLAPGAAPTGYPRLRPALVVTAGAGAVLSAGGLITAWMLERELHDRDWGRHGTELERLRAWNNTAYVGGVAGSVVAGAAGLGFVVSFR